MNHRTGTWSARALLPEGPAERVRIVAGGGRIERLEVDVPPEADDEQHPTGWLCPGLVDLQVNGALGAGFDHPSPERRAEAVRWHLTRGTTTLLATLVSAPVDRLEAALLRLADEVDPAGPIAGIHLEGPFLAEAKSGAHARSALVPPDVADAQRLLDAAGGTLRLLTLAPELPGALEVVERLVRADVVVAAGHSLASSVELVAAVDRGLSFVTHVGNATEWPSRPYDPSVGYRRSEPGVIGTFLFERRLGGSLILDGRHLAPELARALIELRGVDAIALVSDAAPFAGLPPGDYEAGGLAARIHPEGHATAGQGLAGSTISLLDAVRLAVEQLRLPLEDAFAMATLTPARVVGLERKGRLAEGADADWLLLEPDLTLRGVVRCGERVA